MNEPGLTKQKPVDLLNENRDMPLFELETIAKNFIGQSGEHLSTNSYPEYQRHVKDQQDLLSTAPFQMTL